MKNKIRFIHKTISFTLIILMLFIPVLSAASLGTTTTAPMGSEKLTETLKAHLETVEDDEYVPVYIWLDDYGEDVFYQALSKRLGVNITEQTEEAYISSKVAEKVELFEENLELMKADTSTYGLQTTEAGAIDIKSFSPMLFRAKASISDTMTDTEIQNCLNSGMSSKEIINLSERHQYLKDYRQTRKLVNTTATQEFSKLLDLSKCKNVYLSEGLTFLSVECKKSYINTLAINPKVESVDLVVDVEFATPDIEDPQQNSTRGIEGGYYHMNNQYDYDGSGIKVGVLEVNPEMQFSKNPYLINRNVVTDVPVQIEGSTISESFHATQVLSIVGGGEVVEGNNIYKGIAYKSSLFYTNTNWHVKSTDSSKILSLDRSLNWLVITQNIDVLNMSFAEENYATYRQEDKMIDVYVRDYGALIVSSVANIDNSNPSAEICSIGFAYNAIVVGNSDLNGQMNDSSYVQQTYLTNKPDISAYGTGLYMPQITTHGGYIQSGTSFATPMVAGAAALVMQANTDLIGSPDTVKAILMTSANENGIDPEATEDGNGNVIFENGVAPGTGWTSSQNNSALSSANSNLRVKSGAGLLNIEAAIRMANSDLIYNFMISPTSEPVNIFTESYYFNSGTAVEFGLVFEKNNDEIIGANNISQSLEQILSNQNNINIKILNSSNNVVFESVGIANNVKLFTCAFSVSGWYKFCISASSIKGCVPVATSFILSCHCADKNLSHEFGPYEYNVPVDQHIITCSNCNTSFEEKMYTVTITKKTASYDIYVDFIVSYAFEKDRYFNRSFMHFSFITSNLRSTNSSLTPLAATPYYGDNQTTPTGEIITRSYEILTQTSGENIIFPQVGITIYIDYYDRTITLN